MHTEETENLKRRLTTKDIQSVDKNLSPRQQKSQ